MFRWINTIFFGICFITALLLEVFCIYKYEGDLFTSIGIGIVVLITAYLLFDSIRSNWKDYYAKIYSEIQLHNKEIEEKLDDVLSQLLRIQKATYVATKKNSQLLQEKLFDASKDINNQAHDYQGDILLMLQEESNKLQLQQEELLNMIFQLEKKIVSGMTDTAESTQPLSETKKSESKIPDITPLYDDPNKNLTPEEISTLFATYGEG